MAPTIPVIDLNAAWKADAPIAQTAQLVDAACRQVSFFAITGHRIPPQLRQDIFDVARHYFALSDAVKQKNAIETSPNNRGFVSIAAERLQPDLPGDFKESFDYGLEAPADDPDNSPLEGPNPWPEIPELPAFRPVLEQYQDHAVAAATVVLRLMARALALPSNFFADRMHRPQVNRQLVHYPPVDQRTVGNQLGSGAHSDYGMLTLLLTDGTPGLQVMSLSGEWIDVIVPEDAIIVNLGFEYRDASETSG